MSEETFETCMKSEYNQDKEAVEFIIEIYKLGGQAALEDAKKLWDAIPPKVLAVITALLAWGLKDKIKDLLKPVWGPLAQIMAAMIVGLGVAAVGLALIAAVGCAPKLAE
jgi:hypothetical protein